MSVSLEAISFKMVKHMAITFRWRSSKVLIEVLNCSMQWKTVAMAIVLVCQFANHPVLTGEPALVFSSPLPSGNGIAKGTNANADLSKHPSVIFMDDFEQGEIGEGWDEINNKGSAALAFSDRSADSPIFGNRSLKVTATLGENEGGGMTKWFPSASQLFIRLYTRFDAQCDYVHHFCTLRANRSLLGGDRWSGFGGAGLLPDGTRRFSTAIEPWGNWGQWPPPGRWNFYSYWHEMKPSPDGKYWGNGFRPESQEDIPRDVWICVEMMLKHNTPGLDDGEQAFWIDGKLIGHWSGFNWRTDDKLMANAFTLESYVTDRWTKVKTNIVHFDNVVIAKEYIGPHPNEH